MASDRATLANVLARLKDANNSLWLIRYMSSAVPPAVENRILSAQMDINYCEGRILGLLADPIPANECDAVDEATAEAETWD